MLRVPRESLIFLLTTSAISSQSGIDLSFFLCWIHLFSHGWWSFVYPSPYFASLGVFTSISHPLFLLVTLFLRHASLRVNKSFTINTIMDTIKRISIREHNHNHRFGSSFLRDSIFIVHQPIEAVIAGDERSGNVDNDKVRIDNFIILLRITSSQRYRGSPGWMTISIIQVYIYVDVAACTGLKKNMLPVFSKVFSRFSNDLISSFTLLIVTFEVLNFRVDFYISFSLFSLCSAFTHVRFLSSMWYLISRIYPEISFFLAGILSSQTLSLTRWILHHTYAL